MYELGEMLESVRAKERPDIPSRALAFLKLSEGFGYDAKAVKERASALSPAAWGHIQSGAGLVLFFDSCPCSYCVTCLPDMMIPPAEKKGSIKIKQYLRWHQDEAEWEVEIRAEIACDGGGGHPCKSFPPAAAIFVVSEFYYCAICGMKDPILRKGLRQQEEDDMKGKLLPASPTPPVPTTTNPSGTPVAAAIEDHRSPSTDTCGNTSVS